MSSANVITLHKCHRCDFDAPTKRQLIAHFIQEHEEQNARARRNDSSKVYACSICGHQTESITFTRNHIRLDHSVPVSNWFSEIATAFNRRVQTFAKKFGTLEYQSFDDCFYHLTPHIVKLIRYQLRIKKTIRFGLVIFARYEKEDEAGNITEVVSIPLRSQSRVVFYADKRRMTKTCLHSIAEISVRDEQFIAAGSGWRLRDIEQANLEVGKVTFAGGCNKYGHFARFANIPQHKKRYFLECPTLKNECFFNAVACGLLRECVSSLPLEKRRFVCAEFIKTRFNTKGIPTPVPLSKIRKFERQNCDLKVGINVYMQMEGDIVPVYQSMYDIENTINLFLIEQGNSHHYVYITDFDNFCSDGRKTWNCGNCMINFSTEIALQNHRNLCRKNGEAACQLPSHQQTVEFKANEKTVLQAITGFCDFECSLQPVTSEENAVKYRCDNCAASDDPSQCSHTVKDIHKQLPTTYSIYFTDKSGKILYSKTKSQEGDVMQDFFITLKTLEGRLMSLLQQHREITWNEEYDRIHEVSNVCHLCHEGFMYYPSSRRKVRDHCHYSGEYLGAAHHSCNWKRTQDRSIPIFIHNLKNYDSHFLVQGLKYWDTDIAGLPYNMEKFRTLNIGKFCFIDSFQMLPSSLNVLVNNLRDSNHDFPFVSKLPYCRNEFAKQLLLRKGVYPYEWAESIGKLKVTTVFPPLECFFSTLTQSNISDEDYAHGKLVFEFFRCKNMLDYCDLYCNLDTVLLCEVMMAFRKAVKNDFNLDATRYISVPQLAFDAMLRTLDEPIELMSDIDMIIMCEQGIRGGVSFIAERKVQLHNYEAPTADFSCEDKVQDHLLYTDANNLYSVAQSAPQPAGDYAWCDEEQLTRLNKHINEIPVESAVGFILEVDLDYPSHLHESHASMPLVADNQTFNCDNISPYSRASMTCLKGHNYAKNYKSKKLCTTFKSKKNYVVHYRNLQTYLKQGLKLKKIHRAIRFKQQRYLKKIIEFCTAIRIAAKSPFQKNLFKLMMNSVYGKFLQDNRKHFEVKICRSQKMFDKFNASPLYKGHRILSEGVVAMYLSKKIVQLDRLYATGFTILELSKNHMNRSWYEFIQPTLGADNVSIVLTDTDSLLLHVKNMSRRQMMDKLTPIMDFSNYPKNHIRYSEKVKAVPGFFKDENGGNYMTEVIGLKSKCYVTKVLHQYTKDNKEHVVCKGVGGAARKALTLKLYRKCVLDFNQIRTTSYTIRSNKHKLFTQRIRKIALSTTDDKRWLLPCGIHTLPHYYHENKNVCDKCHV